MLRPSVAADLQILLVRMIVLQDRKIRHTLMIDLLCIFWLLSVRC